jgi:hypothetical protein
MIYNPTNLMFSNGSRPAVRLAIVPLILMLQEAKPPDLAHIYPSHSQYQSSHSLWLFWSNFGAVRRQRLLA